MPVLTAGRSERIRREVIDWCDVASGATELLEGVAHRLHPALGHDAGSWLATDPTTVLFTEGYVEGFEPSTCVPWFHHELRVPNVATFAQIARGRPAAVALSDATGGDLAASARWREVLEPAGYGQELRVVFRRGRATWGVAAIHRRSDRPDFGPAEAELVASLSEPVGTALRRLVVDQRRAVGEPDGPGLLFVSSEGEVRSATPSGVRWLEQLGVSEGVMTHPALFTLGELSRGDAAVHDLRLRTVDGRWVRLHAERMLGHDGSFAVVVEPSRTADVADIAAMAHGLSAREQQLTFALARGGSTTEVASRLGISPHTVRDHLKSIFDKTDVTSRNELVARLFHDHYADRFHERATIRH